MPSHGHYMGAESACREGEHVTVKVVAIIGVLSASVVFIASLIGVPGLGLATKYVAERQRSCMSIG